MSSEDLNNYNYNYNSPVYTEESRDSESSFINPFKDQTPDKLNFEECFDKKFFNDLPICQKIEKEGNINNIPNKIKVNEEKTEGPINIIHNSTAYTSKELSKIKKKIFEIEKVTLQEKIKRAYNKLKDTKMYRKDYYIKRYKTKFVDWLIKKLNNCKKNCEFSIKLFDFKIPDSFSFTSIPKIGCNYNFLSLKIKEILKLGENSENKNSPYWNKELIKIIENYETKCKNKKKYDELISLINNSLKNTYYEFYDDKEAFKNLCNDKMMLFYEYHFQKETKNEFSLLKKYGFIEVLEKYHK